MAENVVLGDAAVGAGAGDLAEVELVLFGDAADERRGAKGAAGVGCGCAARLDCAGGLGRRRSADSGWRSLRLRRGRTADDRDDCVDLDGCAFGILISVRMPATGEGISASTLSVEISKSGSSFSTWSPTFLSHLVMVPSTMDSPICGMTMSVSVRAARCLAAGAAPPMTATTVLMPTVAPSGTLISLRMPASGEGISASTLSVEISKRGSSFSTRSPGFLSHLVMVPSTIDSPIWGMITSVGMNPSLRDSGRVYGAAVPAGL